VTTVQDSQAGRDVGRGRWLTLGRVGLIALALLVIAIAATTTYRSADSSGSAGEPAKFDAAEYGAATYPKVVPAIEKRAVDIVTLQRAIAADSGAAGARYGTRQGTGPYSYAVELTGTAGTVSGGLLAVTVPGIGKAHVSVQVGPAVNGTALRDAVGFIKFGQFVNQVDYADAGTALNNRMKSKLLAGLDAASLKGKQITVVGAMTPLTGDVLTVTPVSVKAAS
jgi:predicted lipoprotein